MSDIKDENAKEKMELAIDQVIGAISETMDLYGVTPSIGKLYATLYFSDQMNLDEMREEHGMSKASMSTSVRKLQDIGMVKRKYLRGSRKHTYVAEKDFFHSFMAFYCQMWDREVNINISAIKDAEVELKSIFENDTISPEIREKAKSYYEMLDQSKIYYRWLEKLGTSIRTEEIFEFLPKDEVDKK